MAACLAEPTAPPPLAPIVPAAPLASPSPVAALAGPARARLPIPAAVLNRVYRDNHGLLAGLSDDGHVMTSGPSMDPLVIEARRTYERMGNPIGAVYPVDYPDPFTGQPRDGAVTAPLTLVEWKRVFGFRSRAPGESLDAYRAKEGIVIYYNVNELGLGRELGCAQFEDGRAADGTPIMGEACFVANFGTTFRDRHNALRDAVDGVTPRNTVCITYRPSMPEGYQVQFYLYGSDGRRGEWAQLDGFGPRPVPHVCMNCHGGVYDADRHLARYARFLPTDPNTLVFDDRPGTPYTRAAQEESIRKINLAALRSPLTPFQTESWEDLYDGRIHEIGAVTRTDAAPPGWSGSEEDVAMWNQVVKPYCATCHMASSKTAGGNEAWVYRTLESRQATLDARLDQFVCNTFEMPNAQTTHRHFWSTDREPLLIGERTFDSAADAFLSVFGLDRSTCAGYEPMSDCRRGPDPDALCGGRTSGTACDRRTGACVPDLAGEAPLDVHQATGVCQLSGLRGCGDGQECRRVEAPVVDGFDGGCFTCGREGYGPCTTGGPRCKSGLVERDGACIRR